MGEPLKHIPGGAGEGSVGEPEFGAVARAAADAFAAWHDAFRAITARAPGRFARAEWRDAQEDMRERLALYRAGLDALERAVRAQLAGPPRRAWWEAVRAAYAFVTAPRPDAELAETWFNSLTRRLFAPEELADELLFQRPRARPSLEGATAPAHRTVPARHLGPDVLARVLAMLPLVRPLADPAGDARRAAAALAAQLAAAARDRSLEAIELLPCVFYRNKGAYAVGRVRTAGGLVPLVLALVNRDGRLEVDAVLTSPDEVSAVFGFTRSYFFVDVPRPRDVVAFLQSILPLKRVDELYIAIGYERHGKTELYRELRRHLDRPGARFRASEGDRGMVMAVFTLDSLNVVFKVIKDRCDPPKTATPRLVREKYDLVFRHDRVGRLADAQEFEGLRLGRAHFEPELLAELERVAGRTVQVEGDVVTVRHVYTERRVTPLNLYLRSAPPRAAAAAVVDYGWAIKDLAAANIFPGDMLLKNFGVTRHGRVIFYDYDELSLLVDCRFRRLPPPRDDADEFAAEPWFGVGEHDVFPEEFRPFLSLEGRLGELFLKHHADLCTVEFWTAMQARQRRGDLPDFFPYPPARRLPRD